MSRNNGNKIRRITQVLMEEVHNDFLLKMHERFGIDLPDPVKIRIQENILNGTINFQNPNNIIMCLDPNGNNELPENLEIGGGWLRIPANSGLESLWLERYHPFWFYDRVYTCAHESAHYLHYLANPNFYKNFTENTKYMGLFLFNFLREGVVTLETLDYFKNCGNLKRIMKFVKPTYFEEEFWEMYKRKRFKLEKLVKL